MVKEVVKIYYSVVSAASCIFVSQFSALYGLELPFDKPAIHLGTDLREVSFRFN